MAKDVKAPKAVRAVVFAGLTAAPEPKPKLVTEVPAFTPCRQCGNPGGCERANRCVKGFK